MTRLELEDKVFRMNLDIEEDLEAAEHQLLIKDGAKVVATIPKGRAMAYRIKKIKGKEVFIDPDLVQLIREFAATPLEDR